MEEGRCSFYRLDTGEKRVKGRWPLRGMEGAAEAPPGVQGHRAGAAPQWGVAEGKATSDVKGPLLPARRPKAGSAFRESNGFEKQLTQPQRSHSPLFRQQTKEQEDTFAHPTFPATKKPSRRTAFPHPTASLAVVMSIMFQLSRISWMEREPAPTS